MRFKSQTRLLNRNGKNDENKTWSFPKLGGIYRWYANELLRGILISLLSRSDSFDPSIDSSGSFDIFFFHFSFDSINKSRPTMLIECLSTQSLS